MILMERRTYGVAEIFLLVFGSYSYYCRCSERFTFSIGMTETEELLVRSASGQRPPGTVGRVPLIFWAFPSQ